MANDEKTSNSDKESVFEISKESHDKIINEVVETIKNGAFDVTDKACAKWAENTAKLMLIHTPSSASGVKVTSREVLVDSMRRAGASLAEVEYGSKDEQTAWDKAWGHYKSYPLASVMLDYLDNMG